MRIFLIGYMGSGKTTLGKKLAEALQSSWLDLDAFIAAEQGCAVADIIRARGEAAFRAVEAEALAKVLVLEDIVVSTGGGTPCFEDNMIQMKAAGIVIYLKQTPEVLAARLEASPEDRPLLDGSTGEQLVKHIEPHLAYREEYYIRAHITLTEEVNDIAVLASRILDQSK